MKNFGVDVPMKSYEIQEKAKLTNIKKLGVSYTMMSETVINKVYITNINNGKWIKNENRTDFSKYHTLVNKYTMRNKKELYKNWNGLYYYTNLSISENFKLNFNDKNYTTIDHKKSIKYGYDNNITPEEISSIDNLCITTRSINSSKNEKIEENFKKYKIEYDK
jgi:hypothetical protein